MAAVGTSRTWLLGGLTAGVPVGVTTGTSRPLPMVGVSLLTIYLRSIGTLSGGVIIVEEADWDALENPYGGQWSQISSTNAVDFTGGVQMALHVAISAYSYLRVRISSDITGGGTVMASARIKGAD